MSDLPSVLRAQQWLDWFDASRPSSILAPYPADVLLRELLEVITALRAAHSELKEKLGQALEARDKAYQEAIVARAELETADLPGIRHELATVDREVVGLRAELAQVQAKRDKALSNVGNSKDRGNVQMDESLRVQHARMQGAADGFQEGWQSALKRVREGDDPLELARLVPRFDAYEKLQDAEAALTEARAHLQEKEAQLKASDAAVDAVLVERAARHRKTKAELEEARAALARADQGLLSYESAMQALKRVLGLADCNTNQAVVDQASAVCAALARKEEENFLLRRVLGDESNDVKDEVARRREAFRSLLVRAESAEAALTAGEQGWKAAGDAMLAWRDTAAKNLRRALDAEAALARVQAVIDDQRGRAEVAWSDHTLSQLSERIYNLNDLASLRNQICVELATALAGDSK